MEKNMEKKKSLHYKQKPILSSQKIETMKIERKKRSATLQRKLFEQFQILNAHGETKDLCRIFAQTIQKISSCRSR